MNWIVEFRPAARAEFDEAAEWYGIQEPGLRTAFVQAIDETLLRVKDSPQHFPVVHGSNIRRALIRKFPYAVFFEVRNDRIIVLALFHTSRNPMVWRGRID
jgi:plasmid stabilization system protein ParE